MNRSNPLHRALSLLQRGDYSTARQLCVQLLENKPKDFNARQLLGVIELNDGNPEAACEALKFASELPVAPRFRAQALSNLSLALQQCDKLDEALVAIDTAIDLLPEEIAFHLNKLTLLETLERWSDLLAHALAYPDIGTTFDAQLMLARAARQMQQPKVALERLQPLINPSAPFDPELWGEWALAGCRLQQADQLMPYLERLNGSELQAVADYLSEEGETDGALQLYRRVLQRDPDNVFARHMLNAASGEVDAAAPSEYIQGLYDAHAPEFEQRLVDTLGYDAPQRLAQLLRSRLPSQLEHVADLGCGSGLLGGALRQAFRIDRLLGCDLSPAMLELATEKAVYDELKQQELLAWLQQHDKLQLICATDVLIYTGDLTTTLTQAANALATGGWIAFTVEQGNDDVSLTAAGRYRHSESHIRAAAAEADLSIEYCEPFPLRREKGEMITGLMVLLHSAPA